MRLSSSMGAAEAEELASGRFDLDVLSPATRAAAESSTTRPSRINCLRVAGISAPGTLHIYSGILTRACTKVVTKKRFRSQLPEMPKLPKSPGLKNKCHYSLFSIWISLAISAILAIALGQRDSSARHAPVQLGSHMIDVCGRDVAGHAGIEKHLARPGFLAGRRPRARRRNVAHGVASQLHQQRLHHLSIQLCRRQPAQLRGSFTQGELLAIRALAQHGVKGICHGHDSYRQ